jgi:hypothetical protein
MRSLLLERRRVHGRDVLEGTIAEAHDRGLQQLGQAIGECLSAAVKHVLGRAPYIEQTCACRQVSHGTEPPLPAQWSR